MFLRPNIPISGQRRVYLLTYTTQSFVGWVFHWRAGYAHPLACCREPRALWACAISEPNFTLIDESFIGERLRMGALSGFMGRDPEDAYVEATQQYVCD